MWWKWHLLILRYFSIFTQTHINVWKRKMFWFHFSSLKENVKAKGERERSLERSGPIFYGFLMICNFSLMKLKRSSTNGFVKISASWFSVSTKINSISFLLTWSLIKWCFISMCFDLECWMGFFDKFITLVLSQNMGMFSYLIYKSSNWFLTHKTWEQQLAADTYSASVVDKAIVFCFLHD